MSSERRENEHINLSDGQRQKRRRLSRWTVGIVGAAVVMVLFGLILDYISGMKGIIHLQKGVPENKMMLPPLATGGPELLADLGFWISLDSMRIKPYTPELEVLVTGLDSAFRSSFHPGIKPKGMVIDRYRLELMKIRKIGETDFRFRVRELYPDFDFRYSYPDYPDTLHPVSPGVLLQLHTPEGKAFVTLRQDQRSRLDDIVGLGASLEYDWESSGDTTLLHNRAMDSSTFRILFAGKAKKIFFLMADQVEHRPLLENTFYALRDQDSIGFTVVYHFPDAALLEAVPYSKSEAFLNPVAKVEVWKLGGASSEFYLYPGIPGRAGGIFEVPGSNLVLGIERLMGPALDACGCDFSIQQRDSDHKQKAIHTSGDRLFGYKSFRLKVINCGTEASPEATLQINFRPGRSFLNLGVILFVVAAVMWGFTAYKSEYVSDRTAFKGNEENQLYS